MYNKSLGIWMFVLAVLMGSSGCSKGGGSGGAATAPETVVALSMRTVNAVQVAPAVAVDVGGVS